MDDKFTTYQIKNLAAQAEGRFKDSIGLCRFLFVFCSSFVIVCHGNTNISASFLS